MKTLNNKDIHLFQSLFIAFITYAWIAYGAALLGLFYTSFIWVTWLTVLAILAYKRVITFPRPSLWLMKVWLLALGIAFLVGAFTVPTIFSGRDQGSISSAAMHLTEHHTPFFTENTTQPFFDIYGPGKALNFPGYYYTKTQQLVTQFPLPYTSFIAGFFGAFKLSGFILANTILLFLILTAFAIFARHFVTNAYALFAPLLLASSFSFLYFTKFTLTENLAVTLLWGALTFFVLYIVHPSQKNFFVLFALIALLAFVRIEGSWLFPAFVTLFLYNHDRRMWLIQKPFTRIIIPMSLMFVFTLLALIINTSFYATLLGTIVPSDPSSGTQSSSQFSTFSSFLIPTYILYNLFLPLICSALFVYILIKTKHVRSLKLLPFVVIIPLFFYLYDPHISSDHPWMLRRFMFAITPTLLLGTLFFAYYFDAIRKRFAFAILFIVFAGNIFTTSQLFFTQENSSLYTSLSQLQTFFTKNDLILLTPDVTGNNWTMLAEPLNTLYGFSAVYFFNPEDYAKLDTESFDRVFLIAPEQSVVDHHALTNNIVPRKELNITTHQLSTETKPSYKLPQIIERSQTSYIYQLQ